MAGINYLCDTPAHNVPALQLLCSSLLGKVLSCGKQKAGGGENWLKVYFISFARWPTKHTMPERSSSWPLPLQDLPSETEGAWRSICPTDSQLALNKQRSYLSKNSPSWVAPVACGPWSVNSCPAVSLQLQEQGVRCICKFWGNQRPQCHAQTHERSWDLSQSIWLSALFWCLQETLSLAL